MNAPTKTRPAPLAIPLALLTAVLLIITGVASHARPSEAPWLPITALAAALLTIIFTTFRRAPKWQPNASGWRRLLPASIWDMLPCGALPALLITALAAYLVLDDTVSQTNLGAYIFPHEVPPLFTGILLGVLCAIFVDARLAAGFFYGYGLGLPTALLIAKPLHHDLLLTYGAYIAIFTGLGVLHLLLKPLLDSARQT